MTNAEIALNYCLNQPNIDKVLVGIDTKIQLMENLNGLKYLSLDIIDEINSIYVKNTKLLNPINW
jgi:predicted aldo/keto reductase-like oxidoreductase